MNIRKFSLIMLSKVGKDTKHTMRLLTYIKRVPPIVRYFLLFFVTTRFTLTIIGISSRKLLEQFCNYCPGQIYSEHLWLDIWGYWDSGWYLNIAENWYPAYLKAGQSNYGFFPLYPLLMKILGMGIDNNYIAGIIISNICLIISSIFLYKLVKSYLNNETALKSLKYLFLFPTAFILSGVFAESLFLALLLICFYYAKKEKWLLVGIGGFFLSLARPIGVFVFLPLLYEYFKTKHFKLMSIRADIFFLLLIPLSLFIFASYCYCLTGNLLAYAYAKKTGWGFYLANPFKVLYQSLATHTFNAVFTIVVMLTLSVGYKKIGFSYWLLGTLFIFIPLMSGTANMTGMARYALTIFPIYILLADLSKNYFINQILTLSLALLQGFLMVFWSCKFAFIV